MKKVKRINIDISEKVWKDFSIACAAHNQTKKETLERALILHTQLLMSEREEEEREA